MPTDSERLYVLEATLDERHSLYLSKFLDADKGVAAALAANKELTSAAFASSEKAIQKADANGEKWRENANEWREAMNDRESKFASHSQMEARFETVFAAITSLKESRSEAVGGKAFKEDTRSTIALLISIIGLILVVAFKAFGK